MPRNGDPEALWLILIAGPPQKSFIDLYQFLNGIRSLS